MASFVEGHNLFFLGIDDTIFLLQTGHQAVDGFEHVDHLHGGLASACSQQGRFIDNIGHGPLP